MVGNGDVIIQDDAFPIVLLEDSNKVQSVPIEHLFLEYLLQYATAVLDCITGSGHEVIALRGSRKHYPHLTDAVLRENTHLLGWIEIS